LNVLGQIAMILGDKKNIDMKTTIIMDILLIGLFKSLKILSAFQNFEFEIQFPICFM